MKKSNDNSTKSNDNNKKSNVNKKKKHSFGSVFSIVLYMFCGAVCGFLSAVSLPEENAFVWWYIAIVCIVLGMLLQLAAHEAGHLVGGLISGYGFGSYRLGSLMFKKENGKLVLKSYSLAGTGGQCLMVPPEPYDPEMPVMLYNFGGAIANLILAALAFGCYFLFKAPGFVEVILLSTGVLGLGIGLINGLPLRLGTVNNDGYNALELQRDPESKWCFWMQLRLAHLTDVGVRLRDMPAEWFEMPSREKLKHSHWAALGVFVCNRAEDEHDFEKVRRLGNELLENADGMVDLHRYLIEGSLIFAELLTEARPDEIERLYTKKTAQFLKAASKSLTVIRILYAYELLFKKDEKAAEKWLQKFEIAAKKYPFPADIASERELISLATAKAKEQS
ncbi:MAG: hypothetical protein LBM18_00265 [Oscillospiraceae bacterium]|jgi:hypothetical protein|nr:hypothetical protein [Oscillospiraceae bacterium]